MTVATELVHIGNPIVRAGNAELWLPDYVMPTLQNTDIPTEAELLEHCVTQMYPLGTKLVKKDFIARYCHAGETMTQYGFMKGCYTQIPGKSGNSAGFGFEGAAYAACAIGATAIKIADTAAVKNYYQGGLLTIYDDTEHIYSDYEIIGNDATDATTTTLYIKPPGLKVALTTAMGIDAYLSPYRNIRQLSTGGGYSSAMGYAKFPVTTAYFFWLQTAGRISGVTGASTWPGQTQYYRDVYANTDGSLLTYSAGKQRVGYLLFRTASDYGDNTIMLQLDS